MVSSRPRMQLPATHGHAAEMEIEGEAVADAVTGAIVAATLENELSAPGVRGREAVHEPCRNCGALLTGRFCAACGQAAHLHRSLLSLGHDILHGVFHFEGRIWRTLPELFFHPGRLTRRYIEGERAKFVSPMALYLFVVFVMFAVFSLIGGALLGDSAGKSVISTNWQSSDIANADQKLGSGHRLAEGLKQAKENPSLLFYKLKINGYKFSWALIPMSVPFLWLLFFWRRDIRLYDHAIFATYSITFMMLLLILLSLAASAGVGSGIWGTALLVVPPVHLYAQLRGAFGLSRSGALVRLFLLLIFTTVVLTLFTVLLLLIGVLG